MGVKVTKSGPGLDGLRADLARLMKSDVLVGIPAEKAMRKGSPINNASVLFIFTHGSPLRNQPPRPLLEPSIEKNKAAISAHMAAAARAIVVEKNAARGNRELNLAGVVAVNGAKRFFLDNQWAPNAPSTIKRKKSDRPGVDLGIMRNALSWVVRERS